MQSPVSSWRDEVKAAMNSGVRDNLLPINAHLLVQVFFKLVVDILQDWQPATAQTDLDYKYPQ